MRYVTRFFAVAIVVLAGCKENSPVQPVPPQINALIVDGAHSNGNKDFFFLPPLVTSPIGSPNYDAGKFNAHLAPVAEVCELAANPILFPATDCKAGPLVFGPATMALDLVNEQYVLNWDTQASALILTSFYRITVRGSARGTALGFLDVDPVLGGVKNLRTGDVVQFQDGRTLPIKVRIEQGAFGSTNSNDFVEQVVPNVIPSGTLDVTTNTGFAGARFTNGWLNPSLGIDQVVVIIERVGANCLSSGLEQMEGCYRFRTDPDLHQIEGGLPFAINVIAGVCFQIPADIGGEGPPFELARQEEVEGQATGPLTRLTEVPAPFIRCDGFGPTPTTPTIGAAFRSGRLGDIAKAGWHAVTHAIGRVIEPASLHAVDLGAGGSTDGFSRFGYLRFATMTVTAGNGATAPAGSTIQASVHIDNNHHGASSSAVGVPVTFTVTPSGGAGTVIESQPVYTDASGNATVHWQLGLGANTLQVTAQAQGSPALITATGSPAIGVIDFETYPNGSATCASCALTNDYASQGVVFSFASSFCPTVTNAQLVLSSSAYDPVGGPANHSVTAGAAPTGGFCSGTVSMNFASLPDTIRFQLRGNNSIATFPVAAFDGSGNPIPTALIDRSNVFTYTSVGGFLFRQETITIVNTPGTISRIDLGMSGFITLVDNLIILYPTIP